MTVLLTSLLAESYYISLPNFLCLRIFKQVRDQIHEAGYYVDVDTTDRNVSDKVTVTRSLSTNH